MVLDSFTMTKHQLTTESKKKDFKKCGVCGDFALGSNFNAITCESCKAFFRRNALKKKEFKCPFDNNCKVDVITRRFCQKCRLKKCFDIGMKKEWIMTEEEKRVKREKIEKNRQKRSAQCQQQESANPETAAYIKVENSEPVPVIQEVLSPISAMSPLTPQTPGSMPLNEPCPSNAKLFSHQPLTPSDCEYSPPAKLVILDSSLISSEGETSDLIDTNNESTETSFSCTDVVADIPAEKLGSFGVENDLSVDKKINAESNLFNTISSPTNFSRVKIFNDDEILPESVYAKAVAIEFACLPIRKELSSTCELNTLEKERLQELVDANEVMKMPLACDVNDPSLLDVLNMTDHAIRRLIQMSKKINAFKSLCSEDQIALLKGGCTELMVLRSVMTYDPEKECWRHGEQGSKRMLIKVDVLKEAKGNVYEEHKRFLNSFLPEWRTDENIMLLLSAIALFTPDRPNIIHKDAIQLEQFTYYYLLRCYLDTILEHCDAMSSFLKLIRRIEELHILNENHVRVYLDLNPKEVEPLLIEIFDLKY